MSEPHKRESWQTKALCFLALFAFLFVAAVFKLAVFGPEDRNYQPHQPDYEQIVKQSTRP